MRCDVCRRVLFKVDLYERILDLPVDHDGNILIDDTPDFTGDFGSCGIYAVMCPFCGNLISITNGIPRRLPSHESAPESNENGNIPRGKQPDTQDKNTSSPDTDKIITASNISQPTNEPTFDDHCKRFDDLVKRALKEYPSDP